MDASKANTPNGLPFDLLGEDFEESLADIRSSNIIHDQHQCEFKFDFDLHPKAKESQKQDEIEMYFFIPKNMGINSETYKREDFYAHLMKYLRIWLPNVLHTQQLDNKTWSLPFTDQYFEVHLETHKRKKLTKSVIQEVKLFGCLVNTQLKNVFSLVMHILQQKTQKVTPKHAKIVQEDLENLMQVVHSYRSRYLEPVEQQSLFMDHEVKRALFLVNEYISYRLENLLVKIHELLKSPQNSGSTPAIELGILSETILRLLGEESEYRRHTKIVNLDGQSKPALLENFSYRIALLKKYVYDVLYLEGENIKKERTYRNIIAATGAALAALWAGLSDLQRMRMTDTNAGLRLSIFITLGVIAYVFKDRIKELVKEYFNQKLKQHLPDFDIRIFYNYVDQQGHEKRDYVGQAKEFMHYLSKSAIPPEILYIRDLGNRSEFEPERIEEVIHYAKKITFDLQATQTIFPKIEFIRNIFRFDLSEFLERLDVPTKPLHYYDAQQQVVTTQAPKVYHINVVLRYVTSFGDEAKTQQHKVSFERVRIVLNEQGIVRMDEVVPLGMMSYCDA